MKGRKMGAAKKQAKRVIVMLRLKNYFTGLLMLIFTQTCFAAMSSSLAIDGHVGAEVAAFPAVRSSNPSGNLTLSNVPEGASIISATLYAHDWFCSSTPSAIFAGTPLGSVSAFASDTNAGDLLEAYKWDVTSLVTGNGTYAASASGFNQNYGLSLVVVFSDPTLPLQRVVVNDGAIQLSNGSSNPDTETTTLSGFGTGSGNLWIYTEADNHGYTDEQILFNGNVVGGPIDNNLGSNASLFNLPVTTVTGTNTAQIFSTGDWFGWHLAVLEGPTTEPHPIVSKVDDINDGNCVGPGDEIVYTIDYNYPGGTNCPDINNVLLVDYLPEEVDFNSSSDGGVYDSNSHTVTWDINTLEPNESGFVTLTVMVNKYAEPNSIITNYCEIKADSIFCYATAVTNVCCFSSDIIYVNANANGSNNGTSWQDAYTEIQSALNRARVYGANEIWVAAETYKGTFQMVDGVALYGGFAGTETSHSQRNWLANETTLTGDINGDGNGDTEYVVTASDVNETTIIDGFIITKSAAWGAGVYCYNTASPIIQNNKITENGRGIYCVRSSPKITNCIVEGNSDSGIYCTDYASPTISKCIITGNNGDVGGGMYCYSSSSPIVANCIFATNTAKAGGGIYISYSSPIIFNCTFSGNLATYNNSGPGGGIYNTYSSPIISNCTFIKNRADLNGGGIYHYSGSPIVANCIFWENYAKYGNQIYQIDTISYCDIQGGWPGTGNIDADPCFVDPNGPDGIIGTEDDNLRLLSNSPCIDAGNNNSVPPDYADLDGDNDINEPTPLDLDGFPRFIDDLCTTDTGNGTPPIIDMGAYEFLRSDINHNGAVNFADYAEFALQWLETDCGECNGAELTCDGQVEWADLRELTERWLEGTVF